MTVSVISATRLTTGIYRMSFRLHVRGGNVAIAGWKFDPDKRKLVSPWFPTKGKYVPLVHINGSRILKQFKEAADAYLYVPSDCDDEGE